MSPCPVDVLAEAEMTAHICSLECRQGSLSSKASANSLCHKRHSRPEFRVRKKQYMGLPWTAMDQCHEVTWHFNPQHQISPRSTRSIRPNDLVLVAARIVRAVPHAVTLLAPQGAPMELWIWIYACVVYTLPLQQIAKWIQLGKTMNNSYSNHYVLLSILSISTSPLDP